MPVTDGTQLLAALPFAPGQSPFRIKGVSYRGHLEYVALRVPGGFDAMQAAFDDPRLRRFFEQPFLAGSYYDIFPLLHAGVACAKIVGTDYLSFVTTRAVHQAEVDVAGVYKVMLKAAPDGLLAKRIPKTIAQYMDFLECDATSSGDHAVVGELRGAPLAAAPWLAALLRGFVPRLLSLAGARAPAVEFGGLRAGPRKHGVDIATMPFEVHWQ
jgi:hypothetical protein